MSTLQADADIQHDGHPVPHQDGHLAHQEDHQDGRQVVHQDPHQDGPPVAPDAPGGQWLPIAEVACRLGISADAVRRRVRRRTLKARRVKATHGGADPYLVWLQGGAPEAPGAPGAHPADHQDPHQDGRQVPADHQDGHQDPRQDGHQVRQDAARTLALAQARAAEMAAYSQQLLAPYVEKIESQAELIGALKERLAGAETKLAELAAPAPETPSAPQAESWPEGRRWWQRLLWG